MPPTKRYLLAPGPTPVPERVALAMARPAVYHRAPEFAEILLDCSAKLRRLFKTTEPVVVLAASATGGMEAAVSNLMGPAESAVVVRGGKFGERWADLCGAYGVPVEVVDVEWGRAVDPKAVDAALAKSGAKAVYVQASETSTGVKHPVDALGPICRARGALLVVDGVTAVGCFDVPMDAWGIDCLVVGSQKALMLPPGLAAVALSARAREALERSKHPRYYFDLRKELKNQEKGQTAYTPATSLVVGLREALAMILDEEGLEQVHARHARLAKATRAGATGLGLELFADVPTEACTAIRVPAGVDGSALVKGCRERWGVTIAGGQDRLKGKIIRLAHLGWAAEFDVLTALAVVELALADQGYPVRAGAGVGAAEGVLREP